MVALTGLLTGDGPAGMALLILALTGAIRLMALVMEATTVAIGMATMPDYMGGIMKDIIIADLASPMDRAIRCGPRPYAIAVV